MQQKARIKFTHIDLIVYMCLILFFAFFLCTLDYSTGDLVTIATFYINGLFFLYMVLKPQKCVTIKRNIYIFNLIFFFFAPLQQYLSGTVLWRGNGMRLIYSDADYLFANVIILISCLLFEIAYFFAKSKKNQTNLIEKQEKKKEAINSPRLMRVMRIGVGISILCTGMVIVTNGFSSLASSSALMIQLKHMMLFAPVLYLLISMINMHNGVKHAGRYCAFFLVNSLIIFLGYSETITRFLLLGAVMTIISFTLSNYRHKSLYVLIYVLGFFFAFSMMRYVNLFEANIFHFVDFRQPDYDAYQMLMMTIRYVREHGISWGMNLISALFCLLPRSIAPWRLEATGGIVIESYGSWFTNVSCPLVAEMYFAFGIVGIIVLSLALGIFVKKIDLMDLENGLFKRGFFALISGLSIYILRGAFLAVFAYTIGLLLAYCALYAVSYLKMK